MLPVLLWSAALAADPFTAPEIDASVYLLDNGLPVIVEQQDRTDEAALFLKVQVGARDELSGERGCAHLFEHLMFEGSANVPGDSFDRWLTAAGGQNNAWTSFDETVYYMTMPSGALDLGLFLESDRLAFLDAGLTAENLANQQDVVLQERQESFDAPHGRDFAALSRLVFPEGHPYRVSVIGTEADVRGFTLDAVRSFWQRHYRPRNAVAVLIGPQPPEDLVAAATAWFGDVVDTGEPAPRPDAPPVDPGRVMPHGALADRVQDTTVYRAWRTVALGDEDEPALDVLSYLLDDGAGTVMEDALSGPAAVQDYGAFAIHAEADGAFVVYLSSDRWPARKQVATLDRLLAKLARKPVSADLLTRARSAAQADLLRGLDTPTGRAGALLDCYALHGRPDCFAIELDRLAAVTAADIQRVVRDRLLPERAATLTVHPADAEPPAGAEPVELP